MLKCFSPPWRQASSWCIILLFSMNACSACECTIFAPAQSLHNWLEQWSINKGYLGLGVMREVGNVCCAGVDHFLSTFLYCSMCLLWSCIWNGTPCTMYFSHLCYWCDMWFKTKCYSCTGSDEACPDIAWCNCDNTTFFAKKCL